MGLIVLCKPIPIDFSTSNAYIAFAPVCQLVPVYRAGLMASDRAFEENVRVGEIVKSVEIEDCVRNVRSVRIVRV